MLERIAAAEEIEADDRALAMIARSAAGSFRDAIGTLDQLVTYGGKQVSFDDVLEVLDVADAELIFTATDAVIARDPAAALRRVQELRESGRDPVQFMRDLTAHLRQLIVVQTLGEPPDTFSVTADQTARLEAQARELPAGRGRARDRPARGRDRGGQGGLGSAHPARGGAAEGGAPALDASIDALLTRIERLERGAPGGPPPDEPAPCAEGADAAPEAPGREPEPGPSRAAPRRRSAQRPRCAHPPHAAEIELERLWPAVLERVGEGRREMLAAPARGGAAGRRSRRNVLVLAYPAVGIVQQAQDRGPANGERLAAGAAAGRRRRLRSIFELIDAERRSAQPRRREREPSPRWAPSEDVEQLKSDVRRRRRRGRDPQEENA